MIRSILIIFFFILFYSCNRSAPYGVLDKKEMQQVLWDFVKADALAQQIALKDSTKKVAYENVKLTNEVFLIHKISPQEFNKSYSYYTSHPDIMSEMLDSISAWQNRKFNMLINSVNKLHPDSLIKKQ